jgi:hypothetical protein
LGEGGISCDFTYIVDGVVSVLDHPSERARVGR